MVWEPETCQIQRGSPQVESKTQAGARFGKLRPSYQSQREIHRLESKNRAKKGQKPGGGNQREQEQRALIRTIGQPGACSHLAPAVAELLFQQPVKRPRQWPAKVINRLGLLVKALGRCGSLDNQPRLGFLLASTDKWHFKHNNYRPKALTAVEL